MSFTLRSPLARHRFSTFDHERIDAINRRIRARFLLDARPEPRPTTIRGNLAGFLVCAILAFAGGFGVAASVLLWG